MSTDSPTTAMTTCSEEIISLSTTTTTATISSLPIEILEHIAFYYVCPRVLGPPVSLTPFSLLCKAIACKLRVARHLYARVFKHKFSFSAIRRRGFEPRAGEWAWQLREWTKVLKGIRSRRRRPESEAYLDDVDAEAPGVQETMYALWIMCLEDDGCNRAQMQVAGAYEWVEGYIRTEMYKNVDKGWPLANAGNSCAMWVFWYLSSKARLMGESTEQRESLINLILPFLTVPFRYPSSFAPANHFRLPFRSSAPSSFSTPFSIPTPHGPFPIYLHPGRNTWQMPHFDRWTPLSTPLAADAAKLVYFSRRETMLFSIFDGLPRNRDDHRARVRARLAAEGNGEVDENHFETVFRSELPRLTQEDFEELNAGLLGGEMVSSSSFAKGGGTPLPRTYDPWDDVRKTLPNILDTNPDRFGFSDSNLDAAERIFGSEFDESACSSRLWDTDWWRLRLCRSAWVSQGNSDSDDTVVVSGPVTVTPDTEASAATDVPREEEEDYDPDHEVDDINESEGEGMISEDDDDELQDVEIADNEDSDEQEQVESADRTQRNRTMLTAYPQKGAVYTPGSLNGLWTGRMVIPSETHLRALLLPPAPIADQEDLFMPDDEPPAAAVAGDDNAAPAHPPAAAVQDPPHNANPTADPPQEAGHRPIPFTEGSLGLVAVPLYVRLSEYAVYAGGKTVPCDNDTEEGDDDSFGLDFGLDGPDDDSLRYPTLSNNNGRSAGRGANVNIDDAFDQGIKDGWFPPNTTLSAKGDRVIASVPPSGGTTNEEEYEYVAIRNDADLDVVVDSTPTQGNRGMGSQAEAQRKRKAGTFHDRETCPGCIARERALLAARKAAQVQAMSVETSAGGPSSSSSSKAQEGFTEDLPPYVPSAETIPPCNGIRDVLITGSTDPRHAAAWGNWAWRGRVRKWDGLVGLVRSADNGPAGSIPTNSNAGKIFFYGTLLRGKNLIGTWRLAHEDPRMPAYEGAFTLGRKEEE